MNLKEHQELRERIARRYCAGTTTRAEDVVVLYVGREYALVKHPRGTYSDAVGRHYVPAWVDLVRIGSERNDCEEWWSCSTDPARKPGKFGKGRLTKRMISSLCAALKKKEELGDKDCAYVEIMMAFILG